MDMAMKVASFSVIPLLAWVISLEVANAERDFQLQALYHKVDSLEKRLDRTEGRLDKVGNNDNPLAN